MTEATPTKLVCVGRNYAKHAVELGGVVPDEPLIFFKPPSSIVRTGEPIVIPDGVGRVDFEGEREDWGKVNIIVKRNEDGTMSVEKVDRPDRTTPPGVVHHLGGCCIAIDALQPPTMEYPGVRDVAEPREILPAYPTCLLARRALDGDGCRGRRPLYPALGRDRDVREDEISSSVEGGPHIRECPDRGHALWFPRVDDGDHDPVRNRV